REETDAGRARDRADLRARAGAPPEAHGGTAVGPVKPITMTTSHRVAAAAVLLLTLMPVLQPRVGAQLPGAPDDRYAGLQWRFVRIKYHYLTEGTRFQQQEYYGEPWYIASPAAEQNLSPRLKTAKAMHV